LSGPIETKFLMYVNARSMVMSDQQVLINSLKSILEGEGCIKNLSLRGRATELNCSTKHHCDEISIQCSGSGPFDSRSWSDTVLQSVDSHFVHVCDHVVGHAVDNLLEF